MNQEYKTKLLLNRDSLVNGYSLKQIAEDTKVNISWR